ncbi:MAG: hypothetical protein LBQ15_03570 [Clostridium sp.]|nr:hypothetical protein [Clostridium sp.]
MGAKMYSYNIFQWMFFFHFYCFFGWCVESAYVSFHHKKWVNRGFLKSPFLPLYGSGALMMLIVSAPFQDHPLLVFLAGCVGATVLEFVTGAVMEALFHVRYWDYSKQRFQFHGYICLATSLSWGALTVLMTEAIHKPVERLVFRLPENVLTVLALGVAALICGDFALSFKAALDLRDILIGIEKAKNELRLVQKRLDAILAEANAEFCARKETLSAKREELADRLSESLETYLEETLHNVESKMDSLKQLAKNRPSEYLESVREELRDLWGKYRLHVAAGEQLGKLKAFYQKRIFRSNPTLTSFRFREALEELKQKTERKD